MWDLFHTNLCAKKLSFHSFLEPQIHVHTLTMRTHGLSVRAHMRVCVCTLKVSCNFFFPKIVLFLQKKVLFFHK